MNNPTVAVVVPTYNEAENLPVLAARLFALGIPGLTLIVVDDGSPDGTGEVAKQLAGQYDGQVELVQRHGKEGLGPAYIAGFSHALDGGADIIVQMDADLSHQPEYIPQFIDDLGESDVVIGSRYVSGGGVDEHWGILRRLISSGGNWGIRTVTGVKVKDATGGFKAFRQSVLRSIDFSQIRCAGFGFQAEINHTCERMGCVVTEHPIVFIDRTMGKSKMSLDIMIEAMWKLLPLRWKSGP
ncbi:MAG: polyprenol monophosphomannose synthase [Dehalococcoidia bacterium]|nr:polyprenol monophosphomannose synthase [Dehalococcoidia bacterium]